MSYSISWFSSFIGMKGSSKKQPNDGSIYLWCYISFAVRENTENLSEFIVQKLFERVATGFSIESYLKFKFHFLLAKRSTQLEWQFFKWMYTMSRWKVSGRWLVTHLLDEEVLLFTLLAEQLLLTSTRLHTWASVSIFENGDNNSTTLTELLWEQSKWNIQNL